MNPAKKIRLEKLLNRRLSLPAEAKDYSYDDAIRLARFAIRAHPREPLLYFYLATFYSAINKLDKSLFYFEEALRRGFSDWSRIHSDPSFSNARKTAGFERIASLYIGLDLKLLVRPWSSRQLSILLYTTPRWEIKTRKQENVPPLRPGEGIHTMRQRAHDRACPPTCLPELQ